MPEKKFRKLLVDEINPKSDERVLEFVFGTGQNLLLVHKMNSKANLEGLDIDPKVKVIAEFKLSNNGIDIPLHLYDGHILQC